MTFKFSHDETALGTDMLSVKTDFFTVEFVFDGEDVDTIFVGENEFSKNDEVLHGLFVVINKEPVDLYRLSIAASMALPDIKKEVEDDLRDEEENARYLSSPYLTGRI